MGVLQLSGVEKYAMRFIEETEAAYTAEQLAAAEAEIEQQKREWEEERLAALRLQEELAEREASDASEELLTYAREDAQNQVNKHTTTSHTQVKLNNAQPRTRSKATVHIDLWTLDEKEQAERKRERKPTATSTPTPTPPPTPLSTPGPPPPPPYSNPNLVIRTRRSSTNPIVSKASWDELTNHVSDPCLVGRKLAKLNKAKRRPSLESNGPVL